MSGHPRTSQSDHPRTSRSDSPRTVVCCFDGLDADYLDRFDCPRFDALEARGVSAGLTSTFPPWTGCAWPSMYTGTDPSDHGVYDFFAFADGYPDDADLVTRDDVRAPALWNYLTARDRPSVVVNVPVTYPAEPIDGVVVPGYLAPEEADGHPDGIRERLADELGEYHVYSRAERGVTDEHSVGDYVVLIDRRRRAVEYLLETEPWHLAVVQVQKTDAVFHNFDDETAFERVYEAADRFLGGVIDTVGSETNVVVCSDHGIGPTDGYRIYLNEVLREQGYLTATREAADLPKLGDEKEWLTGDDEPSGDGESNSDDQSLTARALSRTTGALERVGVTPDDLASVADRVGVLPYVTERFSGTLRNSLERGVDWRASRAYCRSGNELGVRINLAGREPDGVVPEDEYEPVRSALIDDLAALETPDGEPAFEWVKPREAVYSGPRADAACDVLVMPRGMNNAIATNLLGAQFVPVDGYDHKREGVFVGAGPGFEFDRGETETRVEPLSLVDVAPLVMSLLGCPVPERMTGAAPESLLSTPIRTEAYGDVPYGSGTGGGLTDESVEGHLADLGYLE